MKYIKLVASDLDGTLLDKNKEITLAYIMRWNR